MYLMLEVITNKDLEEWFAYGKSIGAIRYESYERFDVDGILSDLRYVGRQYAGARNQIRQSQAGI
jgi:hypothetical protein